MYCTFQQCDIPTTTSYNKNQVSISNLLQYLHRIHWSSCPRCRRGECLQNLNMRAIQPRVNISLQQPQATII